MSLPLEQLQTQFSGALVDDAIPQELCDAFIESDVRARARITLYRRNVAGAWRQALAAAYPVVHALIGDECFSDLARAYGTAHPSTSGDLTTFGAMFAEFAADWPATRSLAYIGDIAGLEWAVHRAHYAADTRPLRRECITALSPHQLLSSRFVVHPACAWMASAHPVCSIWLAHRPGADVELSTITHKAEFALITRRNWCVELRQVTRGDVVALDALRAGADIDETIAAALQADPAFDFGKAFVRWLDANALADFDDAKAGM